MPLKTIGMKIYHNPRCKKSREGLAYLQSKSTDFEIVDYLKSPISEDDFREILMKIHKKPSEIIRPQEEVYKKQLKGKKFTDDEWIKIILENPKLLQRPIVVGKTKAVLAQPPEEINKLIQD